MTSPARYAPSEWLAATGSLVSLPDSETSASFAQHVTKHLLHAKRSQVRAAQTQMTSAERVRAWEELLSAGDEAESRELFTSRPKDAICYFGSEFGKTAERQLWSTLVEIYEACYRIASREGSQTDSSRNTRGASKLSAAYLARTRWILLSEHFAGRLCPRNDDVRRVNDGDPRRLIVLAEQARDDWLGVLAAIEDYPQLAGRIRDIEHEIAALIIVPITEEALKSCSGGSAASMKAGSDPVGEEISRFAATRLLLPRFAWGAATKTYLVSATRTSRLFSAAACAAILATLAQLAVAIFSPSKWEYTAAAGTAAGAYLLIVMSMAADARAAWPWLLRQPASAAVGLLALAAFGPSWWFTGGAHGSTGRAVIVIAGLAGAALLYLYIEAIGHGVRGWRLARRPPLIGLIGFSHGLLISLIGLRFLMPVFAAGPTPGPPLSCWYAGSCHGLALPAPALLGLAAAWSLAAGVFLQIIWDDQPVTAPLAHVSWRRGG